MKNKTPHKKSTPRIAVNINVSCDAVRFDRDRTVGMIRKTARQFGIKKAQINFAVLGDRAITNLNRKYLKKSRATDVISFDLSDYKDDLKNFDIAVNAEMAARQAKSGRCRAQAELALYFLHGLLHNLGFNDSTAGKAAKMHKTEDAILKKYGFGIVYNRER